METLLGFFADRPPPVIPRVPAEPDLTPEQLALIDQACRRSAVVWVRPFDEGRPRLAWHTWDGSAVLLVHGPGEQRVPPLGEVAEVVVPSKQTGARLVTFAARVEIVVADTPQWQQAATALAAVRLNGVGPAGQLAAWQARCQVIRLVPWTVLAAGPGGAAAPSGAASPAVSTETTLTRRPWHLGGRSRRAARLSSPQRGES